jgi:sugar lactone lactonase YvrE
LIVLGALVTGDAYAIDAGQILVADQGSNAVVQIDPVTGDQVVIASGAPFVTLSGITFDARRRVIYVSDRGDGAGAAAAILRVDPETGDVTTIAEGGDLLEPAALLVESSRSTLLVANGIPGSLIRVNLFSGEQTIVTAATAASGLLFAGGTNYFVSHTSGIAIQKYDLDDPLNPIVVGAAGSFQAPTGIGGPIGGLHYVAENAGGKLIEINLSAYDPNFPDANQTVVADGGDITSPYSVIRENSDSVLITDPGALAGAVFRINRSDGAQTQLAALNGAAAVAVAADCSVYAAGTSPIQLIRIPPGGGSFTIVAADGELAGPTGLVVDPDGMIAVLDAARVIRIDPDNYDPGNKTANQTVLDDDGVPVNPTAIESDEESHYMLADPAADGAMGDLVKVFNGGGGQLVDVDDALGNVTGLALKRRSPRPDEVIVAALNLKRLVRVDPDTGEQVAVSTLGWLDQTNGVAIRDERTAFVCTARASILLVDLATGQQTLLHTASGDPQFNDTILQDVALDREGNAWVIDEKDGNNGDTTFEGRIFRIDGQTLAVTEQISDPLLAGAKGLDVDADGVLWIAISISGIGVNTDKIVKYDPNGQDGVVQVASGTPLTQPGDVVVMPSGPFAGALFIPDNQNLIQMDPSDGMLTIVDSGGAMTGAFNATVDNDMNILTGGRFTPYNLLRHTFTSDGGATPSSVEQRVLSRGVNITTMTGLAVMPIPEPGPTSAALASLLTLATLTCWRARKAGQQTLDGKD